MTQENALLAMIALAVALIALLAWAWARRRRRDAGLHAPVGEVPAEAVERSRFSGLYVATTRHDAPLERLRIDRLDYRSRVDVIVTSAGVALDLTGQPRIFLARTQIAAADQSTAAIDRVVEKDGLVRVVWRLDDATTVDSYFRPQTGSARALVEAIRPLLTTTPTGNEA